MNHSDTPKNCENNWSKAFDSNC